MKKQRTRFDRLAVAVAGGSTIAKAALTLRIPARTAYRWASDPRFKRRVTQLRNRVADATLGAITKATVAAVETLQKMLESTDDTVKVRAARSILAEFVRFKNSVDVAERLERLEQATDKMEDSRRGFHPSEN